MAFILTIRERGGYWAGRDPVTSVHHSRDEAKVELVDYVSRSWYAEMGGEDLPADEDTLIDRYFEDVLASYEITEAT